MLALERSASTLVKPTQLLLKSQNDFHALQIWAVTFRHGAVVSDDKFLPHNELVPKNMFMWE